MDDFEVLSKESFHKAKKKKLLGVGLSSRDTLCGSNGHFQAEKEILSGLSKVERDEISLSHALSTERQNQSYSRFCELLFVSSPSLPCLHSPGERPNKWDESE